jgi:F-type H+-transporting ATPase subunit alpha
MVDVLKQKQFAPLTVGEQVISILAGSTGMLDDIEVASVAHFIDELLDWLKLEAPEYIDQINETLDLPDELKDELKEAVEAFKTIYKFSFGG